MEKEINNNNLYKIKVYYFLMSLFRRLTVEEKNIKDLLKTTTKIISSDEKHFEYDRNVSFLNLQIENYSGKYKKRFLKKFERIKADYRLFLKYDLRDIPAF